ncbi:MAG TPA: thiamine pyrophosphate-dependent enzyme, partial [Gemmatimonadota bacterium]|nr:thiamine pyrophosphate-dependent enzyme [Gemmatimonadota bacterium]
MATPLEAIGTKIESEDTYGLEDEDLLELYRTMVTSRHIDDREMSMKRQGKIFFQISGAGHEAINVAAGKAMRPGYDWLFPYYRDRALCLQLGVTPLEMFLQAVGAADDPASGGREMPSHFGHRKLNIPTSSSPVGSQYLPAVGCAEAVVRAAKIGVDQDTMSYHDDEVVVVSGGEGSTSEGEFWEALNTACNLKLPVVFLIEDNGYAISVPIEVQTAGGSISKLVSGYPDLLVREVDGTNPLESYRVMQEAIGHCRERKGPALVHAHVIRPYSHSMSDNEELYKTSAERDDEAARDPIPNFGEYLVRRGIATEEELEALRDEVGRKVAEAADEAAGHEQPEPGTIYLHVVSDRVDPRSDDFETEPQLEGNETTMVDLLNMCLRDEMERDARIVVFGEDVADASREEVLDEVKGKGGVFKVTAGLQRRFGGDRVFNSPLAEANIVGRAVGMATRGLKPVAEIQFIDYIWPGYNQIRSELATMRWRSNGHFSAPAVIRATYGGYLGGGAMYHSQSSASLFTHIPGLHVVCPSNALDANGLLRTAIRCDDPVLFFEHKHLYRQTYNKSAYPGPDYMIPFGRARVVEEGDDLTVVTYGALVERTRKAMRALEKDGNPVSV